MKQQTSNPAPNFFLASAADFKKIPGSPIAYYANAAALIAFDNDSVEQHFDAKKGMAIGDNAMFLRAWAEVSHNSINFNAYKSDDTYEHKWYPCLHGGLFRKWSSNKEFVVNWKNDGFEPKNAITEKTGDHWSRYIISTGYFFKQGINWTAISSSSFSARFHPPGFCFTSASMAAFARDKDINILLCMVNSKVGRFFFSLLSPTLNCGIAELKKMPFLTRQGGIEVSFFVDKIINVFSADWDCYETSWGFTSLSLLKTDFVQSTLKATYQKLHSYWQAMTLEMQQLEEENNRIFIDAYGLQDELTPEVPLSEITLTCNPHYRYNGNKTEAELEALLLTDTMEELISYAIGCMMGRYSLDGPGLIYASAGISILTRQNIKRFQPTTTASSPSWTCHGSSMTPPTGLWNS